MIKINCIRKKKIKKEKKKKKKQTEDKPITDRITIKLKQDYKNNPEIFKLSFN